MAKPIISLAVLSIILLSGCHHAVEPENTIPAWLAKVIQQLEAEPFGKTREGILKSKVFILQVC